MRRWRVPDGTAVAELGVAGAPYVVLAPDHTVSHRYEDGVSEYEGKLEVSYRVIAGMLCRHYRLEDYPGAEATVSDDVELRGLVLLGEREPPTAHDVAAAVAAAANHERERERAIQIETEVRASAFELPWPELAAARRRLAESAARWNHRASAALLALLAEMSWLSRTMALGPALPALCAACQLPVFEQTSWTPHDAVEPDWSALPDVFLEAHAALLYEGQFQADADNPGGAAAWRGAAQAVRVAGAAVLAAGLPR